jgi:hypothetical protein
MRVAPEAGLGAIRFSLGRETTRLQFKWVSNRGGDDVSVSAKSSL